MDIYPSKYDPTCNLVGRSNVIDATTGAATDPLQTSWAIFLTLNNLTIAKPNWRFKIVGIDRRLGARIGTSVNIYEDDEYLGSVSIDYKGSSHKLRVKNERISAKRGRGDSYYTEDPQKAELAIRKHFFRLDKSERVNKAFDAADGVIESIHRDKSWQQSREKSNLFKMETEFTTNNLQQYLREFPSQQQHYDAYMKAKAEAEVTHYVKEQFDNKATTLVVLDGTQYIVRVKDTTKTYTDDTLPYELRGKLGLLKLVEDRQIVSNAGCRVDKTTFVLLSDEKEQA